MTIPPTIEWRANAVRLIDQRALPGRLQFLDCHDVDTLCDAIETLAVRGAPALGAAGAFGVALAACTTPETAHVHDAAERIANTRPTAVNLAWGVRRALEAFDEGGFDSALTCARDIAAHDVAINQQIGANGIELIRADAAVLTHCNTGALACVGYGTALGVIRAAAEAGRRPRVWADETRPLLQGARLTMWELDQLGIDATLVPDGAAAALMARGLVDVVMVGADRIAANGDVANKIGTYALAVAAKYHGIAFYVAAPTSTVDLQTPNGASITIEERDPAEVTHAGGAAVAPAGVVAYNPAFDVTPAALVSAIVTEVGIARPPFEKSLAGVAVSPAP